MRIAHENYVVPPQVIDSGMRDWSINVFDAIKNPHNLFLSLVVILSFFAVIGLYYLFAVSKTGIIFNRKLERLEPFGHVILRVALALSFLASAYFNSFLGPEISLTSIPLGEVLKPVLYIICSLILLGLFTEIASVIGLIILILTTLIYKDYIVTYFNYFGELLVLIFWGSKFMSLDGLLRKANGWVNSIKDWEIPLIRITYGISVLYPAITIKILHPVIMIEIVERYNLTEIRWLFPSDPLLISLGTGAMQVVVGLAIIFGFATRFNAFLTLILYILSIIYFKEAVWPHYILLALALYLIINNGGKYSIDNWIQNGRIKKLGLKNI